MCKVKAEIKSYQDADNFLGGYDARGLAPNTQVQREEENIIIILYNTIILRYIPNGCIDYYNGKQHSTKLTLQRMNQFSPDDMLFYRTYNNIYMVKS